MNEMCSNRARSIRVLSLCGTALCALTGRAAAQGPAATPEPASPTAAHAPPPAPATPPADAEAWAPVYTGSFFTRYEMRANYDDMGVSRGRFLEGDAVFYRARFGIGTGLIDVGNDLKVALQFTPQSSGVFGALTAAGAPSTVADATLGLHEGYARVQGTYLRFDVGRFELNYGESLVIGSLDWHETGRSFDGARLRLAQKPNSAWLDLFATMVSEGRDPVLVGTPGAKGLGFGDGDAYFFGAYAALGPALMPGLDLDLYALGSGVQARKNIKLVDPANAANSALYKKEGAAQGTFGARIKHKLKWFDYRAEAGLQVGSRPGAAPRFTVAPGTMSPLPLSEQKAVSVRAFHIDAELGLSLAEDKLRMSVEGIYASGDDPATKKHEGWDELYPTAHKFLGLADVLHQGSVQRTNVTSGVVHLTLKPTKKFSLQADGHLFVRPEKTAMTKAGRAGAEIDVGAAYALGKGLKLRALYAVFLPDKDHYPVNPAAPLAGQVDPIHYAELELRYDL